MKNTVPTSQRLISRRIIWDIVIETEEELKEIETLIKNACKCKNVSIETIVQAVKDGNDTIEKVVEVTKAGSACGRCAGIITNIIENKR